MVKLNNSTAVMLIAFAECILVIHFASVLFGAPLYQKFTQTFMFSVLQALFLLPVLIKERKSILSLKEYKDGSRLYIYGLITVLLGSSIVVPLDWNRPWQKWPIPQTFASCFCIYAHSLFPYKYKLIK